MEIQNETEDLNSATNEVRISIKDLKNFLISPRKYYYNMHGTESENKSTGLTRELFAGALFDIINYPESFYNTFIEVPKFDKRSKEGKEKYETFCQENEGKILITEEELETITEISSFVKSYPSVDMLFKNSRSVGCTFCKKEFQTNISIVGNVDLSNDDQNCILEIVRFFDISFRSLSKEEYLNQYAINAAIYMDLLGFDNYYLFAVEKEAPYQTSVYQIPEDLIEWGREQYIMALNLIRWSYDNGYWCDHTEFEVLKECYNNGTMYDANERLIAAPIIRTLKQ